MQENANFHRASGFATSRRAGAERAEAGSGEQSGADAEAG
jgi:hypothetical protein